MTRATASGDVDEVVRITRAYIDARNYRRAEEILRAALAENPTNPTLLTEHARTRYYMKDWAAAAYSAYAALSILPNDELAMRIYALALGGQNRLHDAQLMSWRTVTAHPESYLAHYVYAKLLEDARRFSDALAVANEALRLNPADADTFVLRGRILKSLGRLAESGADYQEALRLEPDHAAAVNNLSVNRLARGKYSSALRGFVGAGRLDHELSDLARNNISAVVTRVLRWSSLGLIAIGISVIVMTPVHHHGAPTVIPRVISGVCAVALLAVLIWLGRRLPRRTLVSIVRRRQMLFARVMFLIGGVLVGILAALLGPTIVGMTTGQILLAAMLLVAVIGNLSDERLW